MTKPKTIPAGLERAIRVGDTKMLEVLLDGVCAKLDKSTLVWQVVAANGHPKVVPVLLGRDFDVDVQDSAGSTALMSAVCAGNPGMTAALLRAGADAEIRDKNDKTALMRAVMRRDSEVVKVLAEGGANLDASNESGWCALAYAAQKGYPDIADLLIRAGANPNAKVDGEPLLPLSDGIDAHTPGGHGDSEGTVRRSPELMEMPSESVLEIACSASNQAEAVLAALDSGKGNTRRNLEDWMMFLRSAVEGHVQTVDVLLKNGADLMEEGLVAAAEAGHPELVMRLLNAGAHVNVDGDSWALLWAIKWCKTRSLLFAGLDEKRRHYKSKKQASMVIDAAQARHEETVEVLLRAGAIVNPENGSEPGLVAAATEGQLEMAKALIRWGANANAVVEDKTALQWALVWMGMRQEKSQSPCRYAEVVKLLLDEGADTSVIDEEGRTPLMIVAEKEYAYGTEIMMSLLVAGADANTIDHEGRTPLMHATGGGWTTKSVELLLAAGADVNAVDHEGRTPLMGAAEGGTLKTIKMLLAAGADVNAVDQDGCTPLMHASITEKVELLLAAGADANAVDHAGRTPLIHAAISEASKVLKVLLAAGADANAVDQEGGTPLMVAAKWGTPKTIKLLLAAGADTNAADHAGRTPLMHAARTPQMYAAHGGNEENVKILLAAGADANATDHAGRTPLMYATHGGIVDSLASGGANVNHIDKQRQTPLMIATRTGLTEVVKRLLDFGSASSIRNENNQTLLMVAAELGHASTIAALSNRGIDTNATDQAGQTALIIAARKGYAETAKRREWWERKRGDPSDPIPELLKAGADVNARGSGGLTALMAAANAKNLETLKFFLKAGADIDAVDDHGQSALLQMAKKTSSLDDKPISDGYARVMEELLLWGADTSITDQKGNTALTYVVEGGDVKATELLLTCGADPNARRNRECSPLRIAIRTPTPGARLKILGHLEMVQKLLQWNANPNDTGENGKTLLIEATQKGDQAIALALIDAGADPNARDDANWTALIHAAKATCRVNRNRRLVERLVEAGANVHAENDAGETALIVAVKSAGKHGMTSVVDALVRAGARTDAKDKEGLTVIDHAKLQNNVKVLKYFGVNLSDLVHVVAPLRNSAGR